MSTALVQKRVTVLLAALTASVSCTTRRVTPSDHDHGIETATAGGALATARFGDGVPPSSANVAQRLAASPRHSEWVMIKAGPNDSVRAWLVYPERSTKAPVVVVIHEIFGLSTWVRGIADQLAADGYIAIAPDLLTGKGRLQGDTLAYDIARTAIQTLKRDDVQRQLAATGRYGMSLPAALPKYGVVGFCWGGSTSFAHAVMSPDGLGAAVVYYGTSPSVQELSSVKVPVPGL